MSKSRIHGWIAANDGCSFYRMYMPLNQLAIRGHRVSVNMALDISRFKDGVVVAQRTCKVGPSSLLERLKKRGDCLIVYEVDDDLFNLDPSNELPYYQFTHPEIRENIIRNAQLADLVTVSTEPLAEVMRKYNPNVTVLPNYIEQDMLTLPKPVVQWQEPGGIPVDMNQFVTIGYPSSPTHVMDFATVAQHLRLLAERDERVVYVWYGENYQLDVERQVHVPWTNAGPDYYRHLNFDIGIAPLAPHPFNDSKSHIKALEYASQGIPVVASDQPPYRDFVQHGKTGFLAKTPYEFFKYLRELVCSEKLRKEMGVNAREQAKNWTIQRHWTKWAQAYGIETDGIETSELEKTDDN